MGSSYYVLLIPFIIGDIQFIGLATDLAVFDIFLCLALGRIYKGMVGFAAVGAGVRLGLGTASFRWKHDVGIKIKSIKSFRLIVEGAHLFAKGKL